MEQVKKTLSAGAVIKLGGSIVTDKDSPEPQVMFDRVRRLAREIAEHAPRPLVLVHGAGAYGHHIVRRTGLHKGLGGDLESHLNLGETQRLQYELDSQIATLMLEARLPVMPCQASASAIMVDGVLESMDMAAVQLMVERGMIPLMYGVPAMDRRLGCAILSGDHIGPWVASHLGIGMLIHATDVDGVFEADPVLSPDAVRIDRIDRSNWEAVRDRLRGSHAVDVTGGMAGKVESLLSRARLGLNTRIIDATVPGRLAAALDGADVGTLVTWEET